MTSNEVRQKFLDFFKSKQHKIISSDTLVPTDDPSVLFTSAGMNQFKQQFMGNITDFRRAASSQKCMRTADLVNVGTSPTHHTFFEMLGNFSFGDYFKPEAILWAWEFITQELNLPIDKLWVSVHHSDIEAYDIWVNDIKIDKRRIVKLGDKDNFWPANAPQDGPNGPCGPCSEIFYDWGQEYGCKDPNCSPACDCKRFSEIWNLVFTQFDRQNDGSLLPLPSKNIDTGMGLERITSVVQKVRENYSTDLFVPILDSITKQLKRKNITPHKEWLNSKAKAIADHIRAACFAIADGVVPSNETRGYVIRKLIRRSIMNLKAAGIKGPLCFGLVNTIGIVMEQQYPEIKRKQQTIAGIIQKEEEMFWKILDERSEENELQFANQAKNPQSGITAAEIAFNQYDTYGVPLEVSKENALKHGLKIIDDDFEKLMDEQRERSRSGTQISSEIFTKSIGPLIKDLSTEFVGYDQLKTQAKIIAIIQDEKLKAQIDSNDNKNYIDLILDKTPFYVESGGQAADKGKILFNNGFIDIVKTEKVNNAILHRGIVQNGCIKINDLVTAEVLTPERNATARNHTATHLLQFALRQILGEHIEQSGSAVSSEKLRFDFSHLKALKKETIDKLENLVNELIWENLTVQTEVMSIEKAKTSGALAFFGDKYGDTVRVVSVLGLPKGKEFCGGTHVKATGEIGIFKIITESSVAQGIRRIEAITSQAAFDLIKNQQRLIEQLSDLLKIEADKIPDAVEKTIKHVKQLEKEIAGLKLGSLSSDASSLLANARTINQVSVIVKEFDNYDVNALRKMNDSLKVKADPMVSVLGSTAGAKSMLLVGVSGSLVNKGIDAVAIIKEISAIAGGGGGGKKDLAQAGAKDIASLRLAMDQALEIVEKFIK
ncbi:MAG: alanine--tRNA ligase [Candidatus Omnitrophica bacterium]|nr:alanine--tRNA ligase [Candidatus Omnitrophota bacterium]